MTIGERGSGKSMPSARDDDDELFQKSKTPQIMRSGNDIKLNMIVTPVLEFWEV